METANLIRELKTIKEMAYDRCALIVSDYTNEMESKAYNACQFKLNGLRIICRTSKITPKKVGQFVTFWRRNNHGVIEPYKATDDIDFYLININKDNKIGQFIFPKSILISKGILSTAKKEGKRGFRVYSIWDLTTNEQAAKTQKWQLNYFVEYKNEMDLDRLTELFKKKNH